MALVQQFSSSTTMILTRTPSSTHRPGADPRDGLRRGGPRGSYIRLRGASKLPHWRYMHPSRGRQALLPLTLTSTLALTSSLILTL